ncbi:MAG: hypothetical protein GWP10_04205 [Nitrospiraceae bacterium]|nr:hypothetical protein [Nitrospiraceae bacterium]
MSLLLVPSGLVSICLFLGFFISPSKRRRNLACKFFLLAFLIYGLAGTAPVANFLVGNLERSARSEAMAISTSKAPDRVVVLCGGFSDDRPIPDRLSPSTRLRILKARELCRRNPAIRHLLIVGGCGKPADRCYTSEAQIAYAWLKKLGIPGNVSISLEKKSRDTEENIKNVAKVLAQSPSYLVTSAAHMPRVLLFVQDMGLKVHPVPCDFRCSRNHWMPWDFWPRPINLEKSDIACHEYIGIAWFWIRHYFIVLKRALP